MKVSDIIAELKVAYSEFGLSDDLLRRLVYKVIWQFEREARLPETLTSITVPTYYDTECQCRVADTTDLVIVADLPHYTLTYGLFDTELHICSIESSGELQIVKLKPYNSTLPATHKDNLFDYLSGSPAQSCLTDEFKVPKPNFSPIADLLYAKLVLSCTTDLQAELDKYRADEVLVIGHLRTRGETSPVLEHYGEEILKRAIAFVGLVVKDSRGGVKE